MSSGIEVGTAFVRILPDATGFNAALAAQMNVATGVGSASAATTRALNTTSTASSNAARNASIAQGSLIGLTRVTGISALGLTVYSAAAVAAGLALRSMLTSAADFQSQLFTFQAVTKATALQMKEVSSTAVALGADLSLPATSANDAAIALTELSKAGLTVADSLAAARGVLQLSAIANISAGEAAVISATQLNAFGLAGDQATRVTELLADASIAAQGEITDFAAGFAQAATAAKQSGVSIEDTTALLTQLGLAGIKGADGGTSLRTFLLRLVPTTKEASQYVKALGIELDKNKSIGAQLPSVIEQYRTQLEKLNPQQQTLVLNQIFGQDAFRAASVIFSQQKDALRALTDEFKETNSAEDLAAAKAAGLSGAVGGLKSQLETAGTAVGLLAAGPLEDFIRQLSNAFEGVQDVIGSLADLEAVEDIVKYVKIVASFDLPGGLSIKEFLLLTNPVSAPFAIWAKALGALGGTPSTSPGGDRPFDAGNNPATAGAGVTPSGPPVNRQAAAEAAAAASKQDPATQAAVEAVQAQQRRNAEALKGIPVPKGLQQAQVDAQIANSLSAELSADNAILKYLEEKRGRLREGTKAYLAASRQVEAAQAQRDAVQAQIDSNASAAAATRKANADAAAATATQNAQEAAAAQEQLRRTILDIQSQRFSNLLAAARLTPGSEDNKKILLGEQRRLEAALKAAQKIARQADLTKQQLADARLKVAKLNGDILSIKSQVANLGAGGASGGFSLQDLFKESLRQVQEFGSNVSSNPLSPGQVRGQFAGTLLTTILGSQKDRVSLGIQDNTATTNELLRQLIALLRGERVPTTPGKVGSALFPGASPGEVTSIRARRISGQIPGGVF